MQMIFIRGNKNPCPSSSFQTVLSVPEFHRFGAYAFADFTAGGESHPALKIFGITQLRHQNSTTAWGCQDRKLPHRVKTGAAIKLCLGGVVIDNDIVIRQLGNIADLIAIDIDLHQMEQFC